MEVDRKTVIHFGTYNIQNGRNRGLELVLRGMAQDNPDLGYSKRPRSQMVLTYVHRRDPASLQPTRCAGTAWGVAVLYMDSNHFQVKALQPHNPNMLSFQVSSVRRCWFIVGCYLSTNDAVTIEHIVAAIGQCPRGAEMLAERDFNTNLAVPEGSSDGEEIAAAIVTPGLE